MDAIVILFVFWSVGEVEREDRWIDIELCLKMSGGGNWLKRKVDLLGICKNGGCLDRID